MLSQGTSEKTMTDVGETYPVLLIRRLCGNTGMFSGIKVKDSSHLGNNAMMAVGIIEVMSSRAAQDYGKHELGERLFGCVVLSIPNNGLEDEVDNVKDLVKHALSKSHS